MSSTNSRECPGLPAEWVNGWLAAVGTTVLDPEIQLSWTPDRSPIAVLHHPSKEPAAAVADAWPDETRLTNMPLARDHRSCPAGCGGENRSCKERKAVSVDQYRELLQSSQGHQDSWTLTSTMTDLAVDSEKVTHAPFDPAGPGTIKWLHHRLLKTYRLIPGDRVGLPSAILGALSGTATPVDGNGLGFDISRFPDRARQGGSVMIQPVVEVLAFFGLALHPVRGDGIRKRYENARQRGHRIGDRREGMYVWPAWRQELDQWGIDALLDAWHRSWKPRRADGALLWSSSQRDWDVLGVHAAWESKPYKPVGDDKNRGFGSERLMLRKSRSNP